MASLAVERRRLPIARQELRAVAHSVRGERCWTIKDPVSLRYFQLREEEHFLLQLLDGHHAPDEIIARFEQRFAPKRLRRSELTNFTIMLHREGLTVTDTFGQGDHLLHRGSERWRMQWMSGLLNVLAIKLPGINPDNCLTAVVRTLPWLFTPLSAFVCLFLLTVAAIVICASLGDFLQLLARPQEWLSTGNVISLAFALAIVKTLHELGHAITCKYFGGECNRLGIMFLLFTPTLYCDVTDAWMFRNKWHRIAVSAAGMVVEIVLASVAVVLWSLTYPGWLNVLLFNIVLVCSVGTLLLNGNPLLRYDGYYILSDWLEVPNLREQASAALRRLGYRWFVGSSFGSPAAPVIARPVLLATYGVLAFVYRWLMIIGALWVVHVALQPYGLTIVAQLITAVVILSQAIEPATRVAHYLRDPLKRGMLKGWRIALSSLVSLVLMAVVLAFPWPRRVAAPLVIQPAGARQIFVSTPGVLESTLLPGTVVVAHQEVVRLRNRRLELEIADLASRVKQQRLSLRQLEVQRVAAAAAGDELPVAAKILADLEAQLAQKRRQQEELVLRAPIAGTVLPPRVKPPSNQSPELHDFIGSPLEPANQGCFLETGTLACSIGAPQRLEAMLVIHESEVPMVAVGQPVRLMVDATPGLVLSGRVATVAELNAQDLPAELLAQGSLPGERSPDGRTRPHGNYYQAVVEIDAHPPLLSGGLGRAKIVVAAEPLALRIYRSLRGTFRLPL